MSRTTVIPLPLAVSIRPRAIRAAHNQLRLPSLTSRQNSVSNLPLNVSNQQVQFSSSGDVQSHDVIESVYSENRRIS